MTAEERGFLILLAVNTLIVILYLLMSVLLKLVWRRDDSRSTLPKAVVMLLCPVVGVGFVALGHICHRLIFFRSVQLDDVVFSKERVKPQMAAEEERESNMVPVEEAVSITDRDSLRNMMLNVVRGDLKSSAPAIAMALNSDDSEASHYAAAALQGILNEFRTTVQDNYKQIMRLKKTQDQEEQEPVEPEERLALLGLAEETVDSMVEFMDQRLLTENEQRQYAGVMDEICELLLEEDAQRMTAKRLEGVSLQQLEAKEYETCRKWCVRAYAEYPDALEAYTCQLKLYFATGEKQKFFGILKELQASDVAIDNETLEMVRVFL